MRIPFLVPSLLAFVVISCLVVIYGLSGHRASYFGYVFAGYLVAIFSVAMAPAGWFRMAVSLSHSLVIGYLVGFGLTCVFLERWGSSLFLDMIAAYPATAIAIAFAIWLLEMGIRLTRFSDQLDRRR